MTTVESGNDALTAEEVRAALENVVASPEFRRSPQLVAFLRFLVESTLGGKDEHIKGYNIGVEVLRRGEDFDPTVDPIVRVEAARLRRTLATYYAQSGARDPSRIKIPLGNYVPNFYRRPEHRPLAALKTFLTQMSRILIPSRKISSGLRSDRANQ
jgi:hypothetical protein